MITHTFARGELQRKYIAIKMILYTCTFRPTQVLRCFPPDTLALVLYLFIYLFFKLFVVITDRSLRQSVSTFHEKVPDYLFFFCLFVEAYLRTPPQILLIHIHTIRLMHSSPQQKNDPHKSQIPRDGRHAGPLRHPTAIYNVNMYSGARAAQTKKMEEN